MISPSPGEEEIRGEEVISIEEEGGGLHDGSGGSCELAATYWSGVFVGSLSSSVFLRFGDTGVGCVHDSTVSGS